MLRFVHKYILMVQIHISKSITGVQKILASTFKLALKKKKKTLSYPVLALYWCPVWYN